MEGYRWMLFGLAALVVAGCAAHKGEQSCPTDSRAVFCAVGEQAVRQCPCGVSGPYGGYKPTCWTTLPEGWHCTPSYVAEPMSPALETIETPPEAIPPEWSEPAAPREADRNTDVPPENPSVVEALSLPPETLLPLSFHQKSPVNEEQQNPRYAERRSLDLFHAIAAQGVSTEVKPDSSEQRRSIPPAEHQAESVPSECPDENDQGASDRSADRDQLETLLTCDPPAGEPSVEPVIEPATGESRARKCNGATGIGFVTDLPKPLPSALNHLGRWEPIFLPTWASTRVTRGSEIRSIERDAGQ